MLMICNTRSGPAKLSRVIPVCDIKNIKAGASRAVADRANLMTVDTNFEKKPFFFQAPGAEAAETWIRELQAARQRHDDKLQKVNVFGDGVASKIDKIKENRLYQKASGTLALEEETKATEGAADATDRTLDKNASEIATASTEGASEKAVQEGGASPSDAIEAGNNETPP